MTPGQPKVVLKKRVYPGQQPTSPAPAGGAGPSPPPPTPPKTETPPGPTASGPFAYSAAATQPAASQQGAQQAAPPQGRGTPPQFNGAGAQQMPRSSVTTGAPPQPALAQAAKRTCPCQVRMWGRP